MSKNVKRYESELWYRIRAHLHACDAIINDAERLNKMDPKHAHTRLDAKSVPVVAIRAHLSQALKDLEDLDKALEITEHLG